MSDLLADILDQGNYTPATSHKDVHPSKGWTPGINTETGELVVREPAEKLDLRDIDNAVDWSHHIRALGLDPDFFTVEGDRAEMRTYPMPLGGGRVEMFIYFKAKIRRRRQAEDLSGLVAEIKRHKPVRQRQATTDGAWLMVCLADWQMGKRDQGGSDGVVRRVLELHDSVANRVSVLRKAGIPVNGIVVAGLGDIVEGCSGFYPNQPNQIDLDRREQTTIVRRLLLKLIRTWSGLVPEMIVAAVPGNHGENRNSNGTFDTIPDKDNDDLAVFEQVAEILAENPDRYGHVRFVIPNGEASITLDVNGLIVGVAHGHKAGTGGPGVMAKLWRWWQEMTHGMHPIGDAPLLVTGHFHHLILHQQGPRTHIQCPALEGGSDWYAKKHGYATQPGTLTFTVTAAGWDNLAIL